jgi:DNA-binding LytR/AlgR family response regulator
MKVLVCLPGQDEARMIFDHTAHTIKSLKIRCEVYCSSDYELIRKKLTDNIYTYDILILDGLDKECLAIAEYLRSRNLICTIIFIARDTSKIRNIFIYRPSYLVTKPEDGRQLHAAVSWAYNEQIKARPYFMVKNKDELLKIYHSDILWFESRQRIVVLHGKKQEISFYAKLSDVHELLPKEHFIRCHQSYIVNTGMIIRVDKVLRHIYLATGDEIEISKSYYAQVMSFMEEHAF